MSSDGTIGGEDAVIEELSYENTSQDIAHSPHARGFELAEPHKLANRPDPFGHSLPSTEMHHSGVHGHHPYHHFPLQGSSVYYNSQYPPMTAAGDGYLSHFHPYQQFGQIGHYIQQQGFRDDPEIGLQGNLRGHRPKPPKDIEYFKSRIASLLEMKMTMGKSSFQIKKPVLREKEVRLGPLDQKSVVKLRKKMKDMERMQKFRKIIEKLTKECTLKIKAKNPTS